MVEREQRREGVDDAAAQDEVTPLVLAIRPEAELGEDAEFARVMEIGRQVMKDHHAVLAVLAK